MVRILFFLVLGAVAWVAYKSWSGKPLSKKTGTPPLPGRNEEATILTCKHCGAFAPLTEGVMVEGRFYCSKAHAQASGERLGV